MLDTLGMPLTNTVTIAKPGGKSPIGPEVNEVADQFVEDKNKVCPPSTLRNCTTG